MNRFLEWFLPVLALSIGVMILTVFFHLLAAVKRFFSSDNSIKIKGFLDKDARVTLLMKRGETLENVRFIGFTDVTHSKGNLPYQLRNMAIVESLSGERILLRSDHIRSIRHLKSEEMSDRRGPASPAAS